LVLRAGKADSPESRQALAELCEAYWYPLYAFVRRQGHDPADSSDLTQGFFATLLEKNYLEDVRPEAGRFRSYLLTSLKHYLINDWDRRRALKRGGNQQIVSLDSATAESRYAFEPVDPGTPEDHFARQWALTALDRTIDRLERDYSSTGRRQQFHALRVFLTGSDTGSSYGDVAARLGIEPGAVRVAVHRLRKRFGTLLRHEISDTVANPADVDDEIRFLLASMDGWEPADQNGGHEL